VLLRLDISRLYHYWSYLKTKPGGRYLFNFFIRLINPYTGALKANVLDLQKGYAQLELKDRRAIRNHLNSIHAIALTNLGEFTSGLALISQFSKNMRGIPIDIHIEFLKKARGKLMAECSTQIPNFEVKTQHTVVANIINTEKELVARVSVIWQLSYQVD